MSEPLLITVLGDSVPAGTGVAWAAGYPGRLRRIVAREQQRPVRVANRALPGLTAGLLYHQLGLPGVAGSVRRADVVIVTIGANDIPRRLLRGENSPQHADAVIARLGHRIERVLDDLAHRRPNDPHSVIITGYWNISADGRVGAERGDGHVRASDRATARTNELLQSAAESRGMHFVDLFTPFKGSGDVDPTHLLAADGDHPNAAGHERIARAVYESAQHLF
ncbi:MAG: SGNH/GDSL hydrolase family protein, partial [Propionibacteriaceae bacterium]|nr:SGNH/GDSL hydrolase family protein [Propionibacteriaceae bacterium]